MLTFASHRHCRGSEAVLDALQGTQDHAVLRVSPSGDLRTCSRATEALLGLTPPIDGARGLRIPMPPDMSLDGLLAAADADGVWQGEIILGESPDHAVPCHLIVTPCVDAQAKPVEYVFIYGPLRPTDIAPAATNPIDDVTTGFSLAESAACFRQMLDLIQDEAIVLLDVNGAIASWNRTATQYFGYLANEIRTQHIKVLYATREVTQGLPEQHLAAAVSQGMVTGEGWRLRRDGSIFWARFAMMALRDDEGDLIGFGAALHDLTERREVEQALRESNALFHAFINHSPSIMFFKDPDGRYVEVNHRFLDLFGLNRESVIGKIDSDIFPPEQAHTFRHNDLLAIEHGAPIECEEEALYLDGKHTSLVYKFPIPYGAEGRMAVGGIVVDITERKRAQDEVLRLNHELNERIKMLEAFSYSVSHDLTAPLRSINGFSMILSERYRDGLEEKGRHFLDNIVESSTYMSHLIEDLTSYSRLGRSIVNLEPVALRGVLCEVARHFESRMRSTQAQFELPADMPIVLADRLLLFKVLAHLVDNALKFCKPGQAPWLSVQVHTELGRHVLALRDEGIGIESDYPDKIFTIFQRLHSQEAYPGTGIGLAIVEKTVALMGGDVWVESTLGQGSTFFVALRAAAPVE